MKYEYAMRADNVYVIDTKMFGFEHYMSAFLVEGKELALIDTGLPDQLEAVRAGIKSHGFSVRDLSYIFVTHEHQDHSGNVAPLLRENPKIQVLHSPSGLRRLLLTHLWKMPIEDRISRPRWLLDSPGWSQCLKNA